ncbi:MAG TPA: GNAT family protein [Ignavibacteriaceae bacterium]|nr:GNAT family protein [Ignavibacteriaceae bacterium]
MLIKLGNCEIRSYRINDTEGLIKYANNRSVSINLRDGFPFPYTIQDAIDWIDFTIHQEPQTNFAIATQELIGGIGITLQGDVHRKSAEIGYWLGEPFWGRGIITKALVAMSNYAFNNFDLIRLYAYVFETNPASMRVLEKAGYKLEGRLRKSIIKDGQILDQLIYALLKEELTPREIF